jgi:hypothetical protein
VTSTANQVLDALPNVLRDQRVPNTLGGIGPPVPAPKLRLPVRALAIVAVAVAAVIAFLVLRTG